MKTKYSHRAKKEGKNQFYKKWLLCTQEKLDF